MDSNKIIGRKEERKILKKLFNSQRSEFAAIYGRRRVGKTFLIKELFQKEYAFQFTGLSKGNTSKQLANFYAALSRYSPDNQYFTIPSSWFDAFQLLIRFLEQDAHNKKVVFIDELPWLDTPKSDFISSLENFWNGWAAHRDDILLIVCGSATSWMINKLINDHGGLHNRVTKRIPIRPFNLNETELFLQSKGANYDHYQIVQAYMAMGGIPFYLEEIDPEYSITQNIDQMFFGETGTLRTEFLNLYRSLFKNHERHIAIIEALSGKASGMSRTELSKKTNIKVGGTLTKILEELEQCSFIKKYLPFGKRTRGSIYQLIDPYSLFYLKFVHKSKAVGKGTWLMLSEQPTWRSWAGYAFEQVCFSHITEIKKALGIEGVYSEVSSWRSKTSEKGAQIDLVIDRRDRVINLCEIKFSLDPFIIDKSYAENLRNKIGVFRSESKTTKSLFLTFITSFGLKKNQHSMSVVQNELTMNAFFR